MIKNILRRYKVSKRKQPEYIQRALNDAVWLMGEYHQYELRAYLKTLNGKIAKIKAQRIIELETELKELKS